MYRCTACAFVFANIQINVSPYVLPMFAKDPEEQEPDAERKS
jgi:hypothetical protein